MKEIKFRQRRKWYSFTEGHIPEKDYWHYWGYIDGVFVLPLEGYESEQYTGKKDKDDKEIYDCDIVEDYGYLGGEERRTGKVMLGGFRIESIDTSKVREWEDEMGEWWNSKKLKVIGNTHDNKGAKTNSTCK